MKSGQGRALGVICEMLGCLPSDLEGRRISPADRMFAVQWHQIKSEDEVNRLKALLGGRSQKPFGSKR